MTAQPILINGEWTILVPRRDGTIYRVHSPDIQSVLDYRNELLAYARERAKTK